MRPSPTEQWRNSTFPWYGVLKSYMKKTLEKLWDTSYPDRSNKREGLPDPYDPKDRDFSGLNLTKSGLLPTQGPEPAGPKPAYWTGVGWKKYGRSGTPLPTPTPLPGLVGHPTTRPPRHPESNVLPFSMSSRSLGKLGNNTVGNNTKRQFRVYSLNGHPLKGGRLPTHPPSTDIYPPYNPSTRTHLPVPT